MGTAQLCMARYARAEVMRKAGEKGSFQDMYCQFPKADCTGEHHSWHYIAVADEDFLNPPVVPAMGEHASALAADVVDAIEHGELDPYLERILAAGHDRKRALRGVRMFPRRDRG